VCDRIDEEKLIIFKRKMGQCCTSNAGDQNELNDAKKPEAVLGNGTEGANQNEDSAKIEAATKIQANYRGVKTRKQIKEDHGFEAKTLENQKPS
jgi:hypothetical protein